MQCLICEKSMETVSLELFGEIICGECERKLVTLTANEPEYDYLVEAIGLIWRRKFPAPHIHRLLEGEQL